jgi:hypothetical protein
VLPPIRTLTVGLGISPSQPQACTFGSWTITTGSDSHRPRSTLTVYQRGVSGSYSRTSRGVTPALARPVQSSATPGCACYWTVPRQQYLERGLRITQAEFRSPNEWSRVSAGKGTRHRIVPELCTVKLAKELSTDVADGRIGRGRCATLDA